MAIQDSIPFNKIEYDREWHRLNPNYRKDYYQKHKERLKKWQKKHYREVICQRNERDKEIARKRNAELHRKYYWTAKKLKGEARQNNSKYSEEIRN